MKIQRYTEAMHLARNEKWQVRFMNLAKMIAGWSKDPSTQVGAIVVDAEKRILSTGFNGFARGVVDHRERLEDRELKYQIVVHAETNALLNARCDLRSSILFVTVPPCPTCAAQIIQSGIGVVVIPGNWRTLPKRFVDPFDVVSMQMFMEAGVYVVEANV